MDESYRTLVGKDQGIIVGGPGTIKGVFIYRPENELIPDLTHPEKLEACLSPHPFFLNIPYSAIRQVRVNEASIWKNKNLFDLRSLGIDPSEQSYWGRGRLEVELCPEVVPSFQKGSIALRLNRLELELR